MEICKCLCHVLRLDVPISNPPPHLRVPLCQYSNSTSRVLQTVVFLLLAIVVNAAFAESDTSDGTHSMGKLLSINYDNISQYSITAGLTGPNFSKRLDYYGDFTLGQKAAFVSFGKGILIPAYVVFFEFRAGPSVMRAYSGENIGTYLGITGKAMSDLFSCNVGVFSDTHNTSNVHGLIGISVGF